MCRKKRSGWLILNLLLVGACRPQPVQHHALRILGEFQPVQAQANRLLPEQLNLMAMELLRRRRSVEAVRYYIQWYLDHVNLSEQDRLGLSGTICEFLADRDGREVSRGVYESADGPASSFILLLCSYRRQTGQDAFIRNGRARIEEIMYLIAHLQDSDGLIRPLPGHSRKLLSGNCQALAALDEFLALSRELGWNLDEYYGEVRDKLRAGIRQRFFDGRGVLRYWALDARRAYPPDPAIAVPDGLAQLYPFIFGVIPAHDEHGAETWQRLKAALRRPLQRGGGVEAFLFDWAYEWMENGAVWPPRAAVTLPPGA